MTDPIEVFDRELVKRRLARAAPALGTYDFLHKAMAERLADRLLDIKRSFPAVLEVGHRTSHLRAVVESRPDTQKILSLAPIEALTPQGGAVADEEAIPANPGAFDLALSSGALHWVNDLPGVLAQIRMSLKPDGAFLGAMLGGETLTELRHCLMDAEEAIDGGVSPRVSPFVDVRDAGALLQRAGFALPVADMETLTVSYETPFGLLRDLRGMGETNAVADRRRTPLKRAVLMRAMELYAERHARDDGRVTARFDMIFLTGWAPADSQPKALRPGSAQTRLADALGTDETPLDGGRGPE